jgi:peptidoglycan/LPS O-acetylase OafA/YrhL
MNEHTARLAILHHLRGIAALSVAYFHWVPWNLQGYGKGIQGIVGKNVYNPLIPADLLQSLRVFDLPFSVYYGGFGVAVFFLITGFVIPASLKRHNSVSFLIGRVFRIYPAHLAALFVVLLLLSLSGFLLYGLPDQFDSWRIFANAALAQDMLGVAPLNNVFWTLLIELKFYLLATAVTLLGGFTARNTTILALACVGVVYAVPEIRTVLHNPTLLKIAGILSHTGICVLYILAGTIFYLIYSRQIGFISAVVLLLVFMLSFDTVERVAIVTSGWWWGLPGKWAALSCFSVCVFLAHIVQIKNSILSFVGDISYPLYLVHLPIGLVVMGAASRFAGDARLALLATAIISFGTAWLIHRYVEAPANSLGKRLGQNFAVAGRGLRIAEQTPTADR